MEPCGEDKVVFQCEEFHGNNDCFSSLERETRLRDIIRNEEIHKIPDKALKISKLKRQ